VKENNW